MKNLPAMVEFKFGVSVKNKSPLFIHLSELNLHSSLLLV
jgi:hypothetical protein